MPEELAGSVANIPAELIPIPQMVCKPNEHRRMHIKRQKRLLTKPSMINNQKNPPKNAPITPNLIR